MTSVFTSDQVRSAFPVLHPVEEIMKEALLIL
jgi:hypothetical protein